MQSGTIMGIAKPVSESLRRMTSLPLTLIIAATTTLLSVYPNSNYWIMNSSYFHAMLQLAGIKKYYGRYLALDIPFLELRKAIYWAKGPNGSGKSTLLKMAGGLLPFDGDIFLNGISVKGQPKKYRQCVSWADAEPLYPAYLTGMQLVDFYSCIRGSSMQQAHRLISNLGAASFIGHTTGTYSSGMLKKLSLVLAFMGDPQLIVLDEPLITLDDEAIRAIYSLIAKRHHEEQTAFLLSSHLAPDSRLLFDVQEISVNNGTVSAL